MAAWLPAADRESTTAELEAVRERITGLEREINAARGEVDTLHEQLQSTESAITDSGRKLAELQIALAEKNVHLDELLKARGQQQLRMQDATDALARQVRAAYMNGRRDYLKLLLNQQDPNTLGRVMIYYDYFNRARTEQIREVSGQLEHLARLAQRIGDEQAELESLQLTEHARLTELEGLQTARSQIMAHLDAQIESHGEELGRLREDQERLEKLLQDLPVAGPAPADRVMQPFSELRGKLDWPLPGRILNSFGASRRDGAMVWQGVRLAAREGEEVHAVSAGQVIFADYFRNLGLLLIVDHGNNYMSLYGHNQDLLKTTGDWVEDGETIAHAGTSGGLDNPALYFEIRHQGKPVDPAIWCRRR